MILVYVRPLRPFRPSWNINRLHVNRLAIRSGHDETRYGEEVYIYVEASCEIKTVSRTLHLESGESANLDQARRRYG